MHLHLVEDLPPEASSVAAGLQAQPAGSETIDVGDNHGDYQARAHEAAGKHLAACQEALYAEEEGAEVESPALGPFCGCDDCVIREVLYAAWPFLAMAVTQLP